VVIVLVGVIVAIGYGSVRDLLPRYRMIRISKQLRNDVLALRVTAIEQNREARIKLVESDASWEDPASAQAGSWLLQLGDRALNSRSWDTLPLDAAEDGSDDATSEGTIDIGRDGNREAKGVSLAPWDGLTGPGANNTDAIVFSPKGWVTNPAGDFGSDGYIQLKLVNKIALIDGVDDSVTLRIARSGMVRMVSSLGKEFEADGAGTDAASTDGSS